MQNAWGVNSIQHVDSAVHPARETWSEMFVFFKKNENCFQDERVDDFQSPKAQTRSLR